MKVTLLMLVGLLTVTSALGWGQWSDDRPRKPFMWNLFKDLGLPRDQCQCASTRISVDKKIRLIGIDNDEVNDGLVKYEDIFLDATKRYDANQDGLLSERECVSHWRCVYGDTDQVARYMCADIMRGEPVERITDFNTPPFVEGLPLDLFLKNARSRYERFFENRCVNRDLNLEEKLQLIVKITDQDNNGFLTSNETVYDLSNNYDTDKNGRVSKTEFIIGWMCAYGDSADFARYLWNTIAEGAPDISIYFFDMEPLNIGRGLPVEEFKAQRRESYLNYSFLDISNFVQFLG